MSRLDRAKDLWDQARDKVDLPALVEATTIWHSAADAEKLELESADLRRTMRSESARFWIPLAATIITASALVGTLLFQVTQFKESTRLQIQATEDAEYREALASLQSPEAIKGAVGTTLLSTFFDSRRHGEQTRRVALALMKGAVDYDLFDSLFEPVAEKTDWSNYRDIVRVDALIYEAYSNWQGDVTRLEKAQKTSSTKASPSLKAPMVPWLTEPRLEREGGRSLSLTQVRDYEDQTEKELRRSEGFLIEVLRRTRPERLVIDLSELSSVYLGGEDLTDLNLKGAVLKNVVFINSKFDGSDLSDVSQYDPSFWNGVAWWRAARISPPLLTYLKQSYPYSSKGTYNNTASEDEYKRELGRLETANGQSAADKH